MKNKNLCYPTLLLIAMMIFEACEQVPEDINNVSCQLNTHTFNITTLDHQAFQSYVYSESGNISNYSFNQIWPDYSIDEVYEFSFLDDKVQIEYSLEHSMYPETNRISMNSFSYNDYNGQIQSIVSDLPSDWVWRDSLAFIPHGEDSVLIELHKMFVDSPDFMQMMYGVKLENGNAVSISHYLYPDLGGRPDFVVLLEQMNLTYDQSPNPFKNDITPLMHGIIGGWLSPQAILSLYVSNNPTHIQRRRYAHYNRLDYTGGHMVEWEEAVSYQYNDEGFPVSSTSVWTSDTEELYYSASSASYEYSNCE